MLPDQNHIDHIRKRLWCGRETGQAAVMIGAGFSRNAEKISPSIPAFPLWNELAEQIYDRLYSRSNHLSSPEDRKLKLASVGALRLASQYENTFGRQSLDDLLIQTIPDKQYSPGKLHKLLLSLPWSDVFTTNYDTLLERSTPFIHERKYDTVLTYADIPGRMKPRIVKLHGSFPSHRPFILTEEDYRNYPRKFAPFVNMVQQSIMENTFCLIGFSGDDPNFHSWIGWVRDNLGDSTPKIYLCGILSLSSSEKQLLTSHNIIAVDLSPLFSELDFPDRNVRHARAIEWFLLTLLKGASLNRIEWPNPPKPPSLHIWQPSNDLPDIPSDDLPEFPLGAIQPILFDGSELRSLQLEELKRLLHNWSKCRENYPGWVVCPKNNRAILWLYTEQWIEPVLNAIEKLSSPENLLLLYELNWRLETSLMPLFINWVNKIEPVIKQYNPFPKLIVIEGATVSPHIKKYQKPSWVEIRNKWINLAFAVMREAREDQDEERFYSWINLLKPIVKQDIQWQARFFHEQCLFHLFRFDQEQVFLLIGEWQVEPNLEFWEVKRASILAELGDLKEAKKIAESALSGIRSRLQPYSTDYSLLSQEGWIMFLLEMIQRRELDSLGREQNRDRWEKLELYRCNPKTEIENLAVIVDRPSPKAKPAKEVKQGFYPGKVDISYNFTSSLSLSDIRPAFEFLRTFEEGGLPVKCGIVNLYSDAVISSAKWILPYAPLWALSSMIRTHNKKKIEQYQFDRVFVATLSQKDVQHLSSIFLTSLTQIWSYLSGNGQQRNLDTSVLSSQLEIFSELLSRFCFRLSSIQREQFFSLALNLCRSSKISYAVNNAATNLLSGVLHNTSQKEILQKIPELLLVGIFIDNQAKTHRYQEDIIEPFQDIKWEDNTHLSSGFDRSSWSLPIKILIEIVKSGNSISRGSAAFRLSKLCEIDGLTSEEKELFAEALWSRIDPNTGLPSETKFYNFAFLNLPEINVGQAKENFRQYLLSQEFPSVSSSSSMPNDEQGWTNNSAAISFIRDWLYGSSSFIRDDETQQNLCNWTSDEVKLLLKNIITSWDTHKEVTIKLINSEFLAQHFDDYLFYLKELLTKVILPNIVEPENDIKKSIQQLLSELKQLNKETSSVLPGTLFIEYENYDTVTQELRLSLNSTEQDKIAGSVRGIYYWVLYSIRTPISPPSNLFHEVVNRVFTRRQPGLDLVMSCLSAILKDLPQTFIESHFIESQLKDTCIALQYLEKDTELPNQVERDRLDGTNMIIPVSDRPRYRKLAAEIAYRLYQLYLQMPEKAMPDILTNWKEICQNDPLPEVRKAWK
jgi:hypothetical protein